MIKLEKIKYRHIDENYKEYFVENEYEICFKHNEIVSVRNNYGFLVDKKSFVWGYFQKKYSNV